MGLRLLGIFTLVFLMPLSTSVTPGEPQQRELAKVGVNMFTPDASIIAARAKGLFAAEGLDVNVTITRSSTEQMRGLGSGAFELAQTAFDNVLFWSGREGVEFVVVAQHSDWLPLPVFVRPEIKDWGDLKGKKIAVDSVDTSFSFTMRRVLLSRAGLDLKRGDYELVGAGAPAPRLESMKKGETFAGILNPPVDVQATQAGMVRLTEERYPGAVWALNRAWAQGHRKELVAFLRAWLAGVRWAKDPANRDEAIKLIVADTGLPPTVAAGRLRELPEDGALSVANLQTVLDLRQRFGTAPPLGTSLDRYYDTSYYREAAGR